MANIAQAEVNKVISILTDNPSGLRLFQVARLLKLPHDHNYWQTYSLLEWMIKQNLVTFECRKLTCVSGGSSKRTYRFFMLKSTLQPKLRYGWDRIIARFKSTFS